MKTEGSTTRYFPLSFPSVDLKVCKRFIPDYFARGSVAVRLDRPKMTTARTCFEEN
jgi:hypothetical protein